ncbi:MAG: hypothetical protein H6922_02050 [Pseudomonadaceae bacterium]|nr:hypothetical protein [Pseudomonadaceae bacterium]
MKRYSDMHPVNVIGRPFLAASILIPVMFVAQCNGRAGMLDELAKGHVRCKDGYLSGPMMGFLEEKKLRVAVPLSKGKECPLVGR